MNDIATIQDVLNFYKDIEKFMNENNFKAVSFEYTDELEFLEEGTPNDRPVGISAYRSDTDTALEFQRLNNLYKNFVDLCNPEDDDNSWIYLKGENIDDKI